MRIPRQRKQEDLEGQWQVSSAANLKGFFHWTADQSQHENQRAVNTDFFFRLQAAKAQHCTRANSNGRTRGADGSSRDRGSAYSGRSFELPVLGRVQRGQREDPYQETWIKTATQAAQGPLRQARSRCWRTLRRELNGLKPLSSPYRGLNGAHRSTEF